jgi:hypothetical protein
MEISAWGRLRGGGAGFVVVGQASACAGLQPRLHFLSFRCGPRVVGRRSSAAWGLQAPPAVAQLLPRRVGLQPRPHFLSFRRGPRVVGRRSSAAWGLQAPPAVAQLVLRRVGSPVPPGLTTLKTR